MLVANLKKMKNKRKRRSVFFRNCLFRKSRKIQTAQKKKNTRVPDAALQHFSCSGKFFSAYEKHTQLECHSTVAQRSPIYNRESRGNISKKKRGIGGPLKQTLLPNGRRFRRNENACSLSLSLSLSRFEHLRTLSKYQAACKSSAVPLSHHLGISKCLLSTILLAAVSLQTPWCPVVTNCQRRNEHALIIFFSSPPLSWSLSRVEGETNRTKFHESRREERKTGGCNRSKLLPRSLTILSSFALNKCFQRNKKRKKKKKRKIK